MGYRSVSQIIVPQIVPKEWTGIGQHLPIPFPLAPRKARHNLGDRMACGGSLVDSASARVKDQVLRIAHAGERVENSPAVLHAAQIFNSHQDIYLIHCPNLRSED